MISLIALVAVGALVLTPSLILKQSELAKYPDRGIPRIDISLNGVTLERIAEDKEIKYGGNELRLVQGDEITDFENVEIKGRGNGTWAADKKPYQIKFDKSVDLFGLGKAKKWCLLADINDGSYIRNDTAFFLEHVLGMDYSFSGKPIELYINGDYHGLYYASHVPEIGRSVVDLKNQFGVLVELDNLYGYDQEYYLSKNRNLLVAKDVVSKDNEKEAMKKFLASFNELEEAIDKKDYTKVSEIADMDSFAKYYLLSEFSVNPDAYWTSFYLYKDGDDDKIHAGPGWDFDLAFGNLRWMNWLGDEFHSPTGKMARRQELRPKEYYEANNILAEYDLSRKLSDLVFRMMDFPEFEERVKDIFAERMSGRKDEVVNHAYQQASIIRNAAYIDADRWGDKVFEGELEDVIDWIKVRYDYFEEEYGDGLRASKISL